MIFQVAGRRQGEAALEDLVQEAFVRIWKGLETFREESQVTSWIYRICTNVAIDGLRSQKRKLEDGASLQGGEMQNAIDRYPDVTPNPEATSVNRDLVDQGLLELTDDQRIVLILALIHERPLNEIAELLVIPQGTVKSRLHAARAKFLSFLESKGVTP